MKAWFGCYHRFCRFRQISSGWLAKSFCPCLVLMDLMWDIASPQSTLSLFYLLQKKKRNKCTWNFFLIHWKNCLIDKLVRYWGKLSDHKHYDYSFLFTNYLVELHDPIMYTGTWNIFTKPTTLHGTKILLSNCKNTIEFNCILRNENLNQGTYLTQQKKNNDGIPGMGSLASWMCKSSPP